MVQRHSDNGLKHERRGVIPITRFKEEGTEVTGSFPRAPATQARGFLPLWLKIPSISILLLEWAMHREPQGTRPSAAGDLSVVRTRHQSGLSWGRSNTSTVWPRRMVSSVLLQAVKSWITTVSSQPPESWGGRGHMSAGLGHWTSAARLRTGPGTLLSVLQLGQQWREPPEGQLSPFTAP